MDFFSILFFVRGGEDKSKWFFKNLFVIASSEKPAAVTFQIRKHPDKMLAQYYTL